MKKKLLTFIISLFPLLAFADAVEVDGIYYTLISKTKTAEVTRSSSGYAGDVVIPSTINYDNADYSVTSIGNEAFANCDELTSIAIPNSVTSIGNGAFYMCTKLSSVNMSKNVKSIGSEAFRYCQELSSINMPNSLTSIGKLAFCACNLTSVTIPNSVTVIGESAFSGNVNLSSLVIGGNVLTIGGWSFQNCRSLTSVIIPNNVASIGPGAFHNCSGLISITIPNNLAIIWDSLFKGCSSLTSVTIPNSVKEIYSSAFANCSNLASITIGTDIKYIGDNAFANCPELTDVTCYAENVPSTQSNTFEDSYIEYATLYVPNSSINKYKEKEPWKNFKEIVKIDMPKYKLTYVVDDVEYKSYEIEYGATITAETEPMQEGYTFSGWSEIPETMPAHDVTITGTFNINSYKLTYMLDNEVYKEVTYEYGATITPEPTPEGNYASFEWEGLPETMPAKDVVVHAHYETTGIINVTMKSGNNRIYSISGKQLDKPQHGLNIINVNDGTTKKVVVK